jgi:hypothetical protein
VRTRVKGGPDQASPGKERFLNEPWLRRFERTLPESETAGNRDDDRQAGVTLDRLDPPSEKQD